MSMGTKGYRRNDVMIWYMLQNAYSMKSYVLQGVPIKVTKFGLE